ncbi:pentapeptide repeat-containing protein [Rhodococcus sp. NPDC003382]
MWIAQDWLDQPTATVLAGWGLLVSAILAFCATWLGRRQAEQHFQITNRRDRFTTIAGQLADQSAAVRLAGVYAMEALAVDWLQCRRYTLPRKRAVGKHEAQTCINVLCSYLRMPYEPSARDQTHTKTIIRSGTADDVVEKHLEYRTEDSQVRQSILQIIASHLQPKARSSWHHLDFDFTGAYLENANFENCVFRGRARFDRVQFHSERTTFKNAEFHGERTTFKNAEFHSEETSFEEAEFRSQWTTFEEAQFWGGGISFEWAQFHSQRTTFKKSQFHSQRTTFGGSRFYGEETLFEEAEFHGEETWFHAQFCGQRTCFEAAQFHGPRTSFDGSRFYGEVTLFDFAQFQGERTTFKNAEFHSEETSFEEAEFRSGETSFEEAQFHGERTRFIEVDFVSRQTWFKEAQFHSEETLFEAAEFHSVRTSFIGAHFRGKQTSFNCVYLHGGLIDFSAPAAWNGVAAPWDWPLASGEEGPARAQPGGVLPKDWPPKVPAPD